MFLILSDLQLLERRDALSGFLGVMLSDFVVTVVDLFFPIFPSMVMTV